MADDQRNTIHYRLVTYETAQGPRAGAFLNDAVFDLAELTGKPSYATMLGVLTTRAAFQASYCEASMASMVALLCDGRVPAT